MAVKRDVKDNYHPGGSDISAGINLNEGDNVREKITHDLLNRLIITKEIKDL